MTDRAGCEKCVNALLDLSEYERIIAESTREIIWVPERVRPW
jgi:hypothetical protein